MLMGIMPGIIILAIIYVQLLLTQGQANGQTNHFNIIWKTSEYDAHIILQNKSLDSNSPSLIPY